MLRKISITLVVIVLLIAAAGAYVFYNLNSLIENYKPQLEKIASDATGSEVKIGKLEVSFFPAINIVANSISVASQSGGQEKLSLASLKLRPALLPLLSKRLEVSSIVLVEPSVTIVKSQEGVRIPGVKQSPGKGAPAQSPSPEKSADAKAGSQFSASLDSIEVQNASIVFKDLANPDQQYSVDTVNLKTGVAMEQGVIKLPSLRVTGKLLGKVPFNVSADGTEFKTDEGQLALPKLQAELLGNRIDVAGGFNTKTASGAFTIGSGGIQLAALQAAELSGIVPPKVQDLKVHGTLTPNIELKIEKPGFLAAGQAALSGMGLTLPNIPVTEGNGIVKFQAAPKNISASTEDLSIILAGAPLNITFKSAVQDKNVQIEQIAVKGFGGTSTVQGALTIPAPIRFSIQAGADGLQIEEMVKVLSSSRSSNLVGTLAQARAQVTGTAGDTLMQTLSGDAAVTLLNGSLKNVNIAAEVLKGIKDLPFIQQALYAKVPESFRKSLDTADTEIKKLDGTFRIGGGGLTTTDLVVTNPLFILFSKGRVGFKGEVNLQCNISFEREFSLALADSVKELRALLDDQQQLSLPVAISGTAPDIMVAPDVQVLLERGGKKLIQEKAGKILDKVLKGKGEKGGGKGLGGLLDF
ncbi:MAG: AsmA family protein [Deltaproteobacteria bacterium]|nr:AsmA family protein [Deltaproteobacteria bacterium]